MLNIVGYGYVGSAIGHVCKQNQIPFTTLDVEKKNEPSAACNFDDIKDMVTYAESVDETTIVFICVPTPSCSNGDCDVSIVKGVLCKLANLCQKQTLVFVKSTLKPGTSRQLQSAFPQLEIVFCPEFLREKTFQDDMYNAQFVLLGVHEKMYAGVDKYTSVVTNLYKHKNIDVHVCCYEEAEMFKYTINGFLSVKVWYFNEIYNVCEKLGVSYKSLKRLFSLEPRIGESHIDVPGHDGQYGFGGTCLPKETRGMAFLQKQLGINSTVLLNILDRNDEFRLK